MILYKKNTQEFVEINTLTFQVIQRFDLDSFIENVVKKYFPDLRIKARKVNQQVLQYIEDLCHIV
ncbi:hypothetical protein B5G52_04130 [Pseudoalteromonas sp. A601]|uniref:hypothetical protein n=1 Tax=Pseudoalteromonas sp. A601 TaxID=1967839 RepID=UPI000B3C1018|nr:hypothetical protein [Pseudoalteromonas sp. A601]OUS73441.1 hypothetical protein B5G52_04130 [Pseudoalteromonas sp. A601]